MGQITGWTMNRGRQLLLVSIESHWFMKRLARRSYSPENDIYIEKWCSLLSRTPPPSLSLALPPAPLCTAPSPLCSPLPPGLASLPPAHPGPAWVYTWLFRIRRSCEEAFNYPLGLSDIKCLRSHTKSGLWFIYFVPLIHRPICLLPQITIWGVGEINGSAESTAVFHSWGGGGCGVGQCCGKSCRHRRCWNDSN